MNLHDALDVKRFDKQENILITCLAKARSFLSHAQQTYTADSDRETLSVTVSHLGHSIGSYGAGPDGPLGI